MNIHVIDSVHSQLQDFPRPIFSQIQKILSYEAVYYKKVRVAKNKFRKVRQTYPKKLIQPNGIFLTGFVPRVEQFLKNNKLPYVKEENHWQIETREPVLNGIKLHDFQMKMVSEAKRLKRGSLIAPTGSGKTIVAAALISCFPNSRILFLCHTLSLLEQTKSEFKKLKLGEICHIGGGSKEINGRVVVATMQTFKKLNLSELSTEFDVIIVDEGHHVVSLNGTYAKILTNMLAPVKIGLTATLPDSAEGLMAMEGLLGPVINELTINEAANMSLLARPKVKLIKIPRDYNVWEERNYQNVYQKGIIDNKLRNTRIAKIAAKSVRKNKTVLIIVTRIDHGEAIQQHCFNEGIEAVFLQGSTDKDDREFIRKEFIDKNVKCVITTAVWREGINIPSLNMVINAAGGKSEIMTLQAIGRGLRKTQEKNRVIIVDFFDLSHNYLIAHSGERTCLYMDNNWL